MHTNSSFVKATKPVRSTAETAYNQFKSFGKGILSTEANKSFHGRFNQDKRAFCVSSF